MPFYNRVWFFSVPISSKVVVYPFLIHQLSLGTTIMVGFWLGRKWQLKASVPSTVKITFSSIFYLRLESLTQFFNDTCSLQFLTQSCVPDGHNRANLVFFTGHFNPVNGSIIRHGDKAEIPATIGKKVLKNRGCNSSVPGCVTKGLVIHPGLPALIPLKLQHVRHFSLPDTLLFPGRCQKPHTFINWVPSMPVPMHSIS